MAAVAAVAETAVAAVMAAEAATVDDKTAKNNSIKNLVIKSVDYHKTWVIFFTVFDTTVCVCV